MQVTRLQLGVYSNQQPFCLYLFSLVPSSPAGEPAAPQDAPRGIYQPFYRLRDIDIVFFQTNPGYVYTSGKIPQVYFDTPGYVFYERSGDVYLSARALGDAAAQLQNHALQKLCQLGKSEILAGSADELLSNVLTVRRPYAEAEFEFAASDFPVAPPPPSTSTSSHAPEQTSPRPDQPAHTSNPSSPPEHPPNTRKRGSRSRMSLSEVLDDDNTDGRYASY
jgi:hypothetical protein